jgi:hypothetical protein
LSGDSGIEVLPDVDENLLKGIAIPINDSLKDDQEVVGLQMFLMYNESNVFTERKKIGKIFSSDDSYDIILNPEDDGKRAFLNIFDSSTGAEFSNTRFFLNGNLVNKIVIEPLTWNYIAISFEKEPTEDHYPIYLDSSIGEIEIYSGVKVDNVASFVELNSIKQNLSTYDDWSEISDNLDKDNAFVNETWQYWSASSSWATILNEQSQEITLLSLNAKEIFNTYSGLSSGVVNDKSIVSVSQDSVVVINDVTWDVFLV